MSLPTVEQYTENWTKFPPSAFPRAVRLSQDVRFGLGKGTATIKAGTEVLALEWNRAGLVLTPTKDSKARAVVSMETTDFRSRMTDLYEAWKARQMAASPVPAPSVAPTPQPAPPVLAAMEKPVAKGPVEEDGSPSVALDGTIPMLMAAIKQGRVTEVTPHDITRWGRPKQEVIDGRATWTVEVDYTSSTQLGPMDAETVVHIRDGEIKAWMFQGTEEPVP